MTQSLPWRTAWITGASSGIGRQVAIDLARAGVHVAASARSADKLSELAATEAGITAYPLDVTDLAAVRAVAARIAAELGSIDLALLNAGVWHPMGASDLDVERIAQSMAVNFQGIVNALDPLVPMMSTRGSGHLALVGSVAGYRGLPRAVAYAPSKAAVIALAETLYPDLARKGVGVSLINPGFVDTPMTAVNEFPMPFIVPVEEASRRVVAGLAKGKFEIAFPWQIVAILKLARVVPYRIFFRYVLPLVAAKRD
ncbi:MAG: SDR family NAD(P)-dependent oxidoreductase [Pseudomonadota bacterium]